MNYIFIENKLDVYNLGYVKNNSLIKMDIVKKKSNLGNIYISKVINYVPSMKAYFIEYEKGKKGFLKQNQIPYKIKPGDEIIAQYHKEVEKGKCPQFTCDYNLVGKYIMLKPMSKKIEISKDISDDAGKKISKKLEDSKFNIGFIVRKNTTEKDFEEISNEYEKLRKLNNHIKKLSKFLPIPRLIYKGNKRINKFIDNIGTQNLDYIIINDEMLKNQIKSYYYDILDIRYDEKYNSNYDENISKDIDNMDNEKIDLENGGNIVIENTVAMTVIDVNTGSATYKNNQEELFFRTNILAIKESILQMEIRDIKGIVIIDGINMKSIFYEKLRKEIEKILEDYPRINYYGRTQLNLLEFTRTGIKKYD